jgi:hypothetical protein
MAKSFVRASPLCRLIYATGSTEGGRQQRQLRQFGPPHRLEISAPWYFDNSSVLVIMLP